MIPAFLLPALPFLKRFWPYIAIGLAALVALKLWGDYQRYKERQDIAKQLNIDSAERLDAELDRIKADTEAAYQDIADTALEQAEREKEIDGRESVLFDERSSYGEQVIRSTERAVQRALARERRVSSLESSELDPAICERLESLNPEFKCEPQ